MHLSKGVKLLVGIATIFDLAAPFLLAIGIWFMVFATAVNFSTSGASGQTNNFPIFFSLGFVVAIVFAILYSFVRLALDAFYIVHIIKNTFGSQIWRILSGIGLFVFPPLAMPFYYLVYVWPNQPPEWALEKPTPREAMSVSATTPLA